MTVRRIGRILQLAAICVLAAAGLASSATAALLPATTLDAPSSGIVELSDSAISNDGTAGVVWVKRVDNVYRVFAAILRDRAWIGPVRIDTGQPFDSFVPRIAVGDGGRAVVTWAQRGPIDAGTALRRDQLFSATLDPGASMFEPPVPIDLDVGPQEGMYPDVAMNRDGKAFIVYRAVTAVLGSDIPEGYVKADLRAARYNGWTWSRLDQVVDRNPSVIVPAPAAKTASRVAIDRYGGAIVAFQEPDDEFIDRVWMRRISTGSMSLPVKISPDSWGGAPLRGAADQIVLASGPFGNAAIAFRQHPGMPSALDRTRTFVNLLPDVFSENANLPSGPRPADTSGASAPQAEPAAVALTPRQRFVALFALGGAISEAEGADDAEAVVKPIGAATDGAQPGVAFAADERRSMAWVAGEGTAQNVIAREADAAGSESSAVVSPPGGGAVRELRFAGSDYADSVIAFRQGSGAETGIYAALTDSAPTAFAVFEPEGWTRSSGPRVEWDPSFDGFGGVTYRISVDGKFVGATREPMFRLSRAVRDGRHRVEVSAVDALGQSYQAIGVALRIDRRRPRIRFKRSGRRLTVIVKDGRRGSVSGASARGRVRWGDRRSARIGTKKSHRYKRSGRFRVIVSAVDRAGNRLTVRRTIRVR